ncbi:MAG: alpha/beta fold hydrolase [Gammaproteobacteria bacterium]|nr:alpha/beta fold hydrolase [Gammaproteobacteria bacterium]
MGVADGPVAIVDGLRIHYERHGGAGDAIVFVHGYGGAMEDWSHQVREFAPDHRVLVFDHRGHGASDGPADEGAYTVERLVKDTERLIDCAGFEDYHLVGHSIGGAVAQEIALRHPDRVRSLVLCDTTDWFGDHDRPGGTAPFVPADLAQTAARRAASMPAAALRGTWGGLLAWRGTRDRARAIAPRSLVLYGERDASRIVEGSRRLEQGIPDARTAVIHGAGHSPHQERPEAWNTTVREFLFAGGLH